MNQDTHLILRALLELMQGGSLEEHINLREEIRERLKTPVRMPYNPFSGKP